LRNFLPNGLKRNALILGPRSLKAWFVGAKTVPPECGCSVALKISIRPVRSRPRLRVLNADGMALRMTPAGGGGSKIWLVAWTRPFVAN